jgi:NitT/TauT family transport system permease protein
MSGGMRKRASLAQTLVLDPDIILMDEPFSALDIQTRQLMENELLALWQAKRKAVLFITHDLDEAIAMSDRVVVLSAGPASHPIGEFVIDIARPRDVAEIKIHPALHRTARRPSGMCCAKKCSRATSNSCSGRNEPCGKRSNRAATLRAWQLGLLVLMFLFWDAMTTAGLIPPFMFDNDRQAAFFFGQPLKIFERIWQWFVTDADIYRHLAVTLRNGHGVCHWRRHLAWPAGLWLALSPMASALLEPYIKAFNSMPRIVLAPIFSVWFGLGMGSKVALGVTLVFFIVFFNVYQGVKEVSPVVLANARMLGASQRQLLRHVYLPSATSWVFSSLHTSVGLAFVGAVVGEYLGSSQGVGYLILQAEGTFDINTVMAGILVLTAFALVLDGAGGPHRAAPDEVAAQATVKLIQQLPLGFEHQFAVHNACHQGRADFNTHLLANGRRDDDAPLRANFKRCRHGLNIKCHKIKLCHLCFYRHIKKLSRFSSKCR